MSEGPNDIVLITFSWSGTAWEPEVDILPEDWVFDGSAETELSRMVKQWAAELDTIRISATPSESSTPEGGER